MNVKLVLLAFAAVIYQANGQFPFGNGGLFGQNSGIFGLPFFNQFRPQIPQIPGFRPPINIPSFGIGANMGIPPFFQFLSQFRPQRPPRPVYEPVYEPEVQPFEPPTDLEDVHPPEFVSPDEIENEGFPQYQPEEEVPVAVIEISEPALSGEVIVAVPAVEEAEEEENLFYRPDEIEEEDVEEEDIQDIIEVEEEEPFVPEIDNTIVDENEIVVPQVSTEVIEEAPEDLPVEFIR